MAAHAGSELVLVRAEKGTNRAVQEGSALGTVEYAAHRNLQAARSGDLTPVQEFPVEELLLHSAPGVDRGPKTLFYYMHGFDGRVREHSPLPEYFVSELQQSRGWDGVGRRLSATCVPKSAAWCAILGSRSFSRAGSRSSRHRGTSAFMSAAKSWGGWSSLLLATLPGLPLDGVVLVVPACCGWRSTGADARRPELREQQVALRSDSGTGTLSDGRRVLFRQMTIEPADRGIGAAAALTQHGVPNLMIDHPPGFSGQARRGSRHSTTCMAHVSRNFLEIAAFRPVPATRIAMDIAISALSSMRGNLPTAI